MIVDGLGFSLSGDSHNYAVVGSALAALAGEADRTGAAILGLTHPPKGGSEAVTAAIGSTAWTALPRISMVVGVDPTDSTGQRRVVSVGKSNYREPDTSVSFTIANDSEYECGYVANLATSKVDADQITAAPLSEEERSERDHAEEFVREFLSDGPMPAGELMTAGEKAGFSRRTIERARSSLGVVSKQQRDPQTGRSVGWMASLPSHIATPPTTPPALADWRSGRSGHTQGKQCVSVPHRQLSGSGGLDDSEPVR